MKKYMVIAKDSEGQSAKFFDTYQDAQSYFLAGECGMGIYCEMYAYMKPDDQKDSSEMYIQIQ